MIEDGAGRTGLERADSFSLDIYAQIVGSLLNQGYRIAGFAEAEPSEPHLILRHDVDLCLKTAERMASFEESIGAKAHYFVLVTSEQYNPASENGRTCLKRIIDGGHQIGLHFDAAIDTAEPLDERAGNEAEFLSSLTGRAVDMVSFHRPAATLVGSPSMIGGLPHTYMPRYFSEMGYCSDSKGAWTHGSPLEHEAVSRTVALQLLTHPIWWVQDRVSSGQRLDDFRNRRNRELASDLADNITIV